MLFKILCIAAIAVWLSKKLWEADFTKRTERPPEDLWNSPTQDTVSTDLKTGHKQVHRVVLPVPGYDWRSQFKKPERRKIFGIF